MSPLAAPILGAALLLVASGVSKVARPSGAVIALHGLGISRRAPTAAVAVGLGECAVGGAAVVAGGRWLDGALALMYAGFAVVLTVLLRRGVSSCGCTANDQTPPSESHLVLVSAIAAAAAGAAIAWPVTGIGDLLQGHPGAPQVVMLASAMLTAWCAWAVITLLPALRPRQVR